MGAAGPPTRVIRGSFCAAHTAPTPAAIESDQVADTTLFEEGETMAGIWKPGSDVDSWPKTEQLHARETIVVLEGSVRIEIEEGPTLDLGVGDMASMPKDAVTTWHPSADFKEIWLYS